MNQSVISIPGVAPAIARYGVNWAGPGREGGPWLDPGETIVFSEWFAPEGITLFNEGYNETTTAVDVSVVDLDGWYTIVNVIETSTGRRPAEQITLRMRDVNTWPPITL